MMMNNPISTVVVVDPDPLYQRQVAFSLQQSFRCVPAATLYEAQQLIRRERPGMVILELDLPDGDGIKLIEALQADPMLKQVLIACLTRRKSVLDKIRAFRAGADDYLVKPLGPSTNLYGQMLLLRRAGHFARKVR
ncbi:MAG TPA: response regulator [Ktedonobacterales bacterium]|nr:response regulator [Ktedonobacterales bacterium]